MTQSIYPTTLQRALPVLLAVSLALFAAHAKAEVIDFNDLSLAPPDPLNPVIPSVTPSTKLSDSTVATGYYVYGPLANAVPGFDLVSGNNLLSGSFTSGSPAAVTFSNDFNTDYGTAAGFSYSNVNDTQDNDYTNQYAAITGVGAGPGVNGNPDQYAIVFGHLDPLQNGYQTFDFDPTSVTQLTALPHFQLPTGYQIQSVEVTNTTYTGLTIRDGDAYGYSPPFAAGTGFFEITAYGTDALGKVLDAHPTFFLANYLSPDSASDYLVTDWRQFDLSALSGATTIY
ncbi:MAG TPA: DUF4465 domain-containing protein, partial [Pirellulales bacterium]